MLWLAGSAHLIMYASVLRPSAEFMRYVDEVRPVVLRGFTTSACALRPLPDKPLPERPLPDRPLVMVSPLSIVRPLVATSSLSTELLAASVEGGWHPMRAEARASD